MNALTHQKPHPVLTLTQLANYYDVLQAAELLATEQPKDAVPIARSVLASLLRLAWARASGKPDSEPKPESVPLKLRNRGIVSKPAMQRLRNAFEKSKNPPEMFSACRDLLVWLASKPDAVID
ncbi:hypothetical protein FYK55_10250 [Roseiconus nitratireducens]|uniref:Uncharacterized protein n=1 Tax=Roseiconus nitratireducens TaxID=2605748 RepID=A0A5M6D7T9_9BACT|nr:hypothetical protein [Roseiconus nitratireducens]KAA5543587.1 hypothetical protein FYK55_10250 [Roseiconus nitratireducens]